jgi:AcrR family transcriptional regulator
MANRPAAATTGERPTMTDTHNQRTARRPPSRRGQGSTLREEIIHATSELLAETDNAADVSLRAIARRVGIATTSIYLHFDDRLQIMHAVRLTRFMQFIKVLQSAADTAGRDPIARINALALAYINYGLENPSHYRVMFSVEFGEPRPVGRHVYVALLAEIAGALDLEPDHPNAQRTTISIWTFCDGVVHLRTTRAGVPWPPLNELVHDTIHALLTTSSSSRSPRTPATTTRVERPPEHRRPAPHRHAAR